MKTARLTLQRVRNIKKREKVHRNRRKALTFGMLYGMCKPGYNLEATRTDVIVSGDFHSFSHTRIRTGKIRNVPSVRSK